MRDYLPLVKLLNGIEKGLMEIILDVDRQELVNHGSNIIGITGPPGAGKSTLLSDMVSKIISQGEKVAVLLIDPSDPTTKGAFLGDRIRFNSLPIHPNLFIRSIASRGFLGGVSLYTPLFIKAFIQFGFKKIFIETVGSGQNEVDIYTVADTSIYVTSPDIGDSMQILKGGSMNNFDIMVINKSDLAGADRTETLLRRNADLLGNKGIMRIVKHQKGKESSLKDIFKHLEQRRELDVSERRSKLVRYYLRNILLSQIDEFIKKELDRVEANGADTIVLAGNIMKEYFKGGEFIAKGD